MRLIWFSSLPQIGRLSTFLCLALLVGGGQCFDYCTIKCDDNEHTMCLYKTDDPGPKCTQYNKEGSVLPQEAKNAIVDLHNKYRSDVALGKETRGDPGPQPQAANMMELTWDDTMETFAKRYAAQCTFEHDKCRNTDQGEYVGQNLGTKAGQGTLDDYLSHTNAFYKEVEDLDNSIVASYVPMPSGKKVGHYTQMIWGTTEKVGCAIARYEAKGIPASEYGLSELMVCDYVPGGNMLENKIYIIGPACSECPDGSTCSTKYPGLCTRGSTGGAAEPSVPAAGAGPTPPPAATGGPTQPPSSEPQGTANPAPNSADKHSGDDGSRPTPPEEAAGTDNTSASGGNMTAENATTGNAMAGNASATNNTTATNATAIKTNSTGANIPPPAGEPTQPPSSDAPQGAPIPAPIGANEHPGDDESPPTPPEEAAGTDNTSVREGNIRAENATAGNATAGNATAGNATTGNAMAGNASATNNKTATNATAIKTHSTGANIPPPEIPLIPEDTELRDSETSESNKALPHPLERFALLIYMLLKLV